MRINNNNQSIIKYLLYNSVAVLLLVILLYSIKKFNLIQLLYVCGEYWYLFLFTLFIIIVIHELIHIIFFKIFGKGKAKIKIKFSIEKILIQQVNKELYYTKNQMILILLSPLIFITLILVFISLIISYFYTIFYLVCIMNCIGCLIDLGVSISILRYSNRESKIYYYFEEGNPIIKIL